ncbi:MAG: (deoxy)nucleoside triphosphate pyrophosphohydrolase [Arenicella sp.]|nr:(deoxy)nucleoside triphosphate pyrophosphohydrolase [Arenicella sp.]
MIEVVAAVIELEGKVLAFQRGPAKYEYVSNKFEFPGGKVEEGEDHKLALARELREELELDAEVNEHIVTVEHTYPDFSVKMHCFLVHLDQFDGQLTEHTSFAHVTLSDATELDWIQADRPVLEILQEKYCNVFTG